MEESTAIVLRHPRSVWPCWPTLLGSPSPVAWNSSNSFIFPAPKQASIAGLCGKHKPTRATNRHHKSLFPFPTGQPCPSHPTAACPRPPDRHRADHLSCPGPWPDGTTFSRARGPTRPPTKKVPEGGPFAVEVSGPVFRNYQRPLLGAHQQLRPAGQAQQLRGQGSGPGPLRHTMSTPRLTVCATGQAARRSAAHILSFGLGSPGEGSGVTCFVHGGPETCRVTRKWQVEV